MEADLKQEIRYAIDTYGYLNGNTIMCDNGKAYDDYENGEGLIVDAVFIIYALAGYCSATNYSRWFEGEDAKLI